MSSRGTLIQLTGVGKVFHTDQVETHALADIHLEVSEGEFLSVVGPSGCGKTTLLSVMGLLDVPTSGEYSLAGSPIRALTSAQRARVRNEHIGFVFQAFNLLGELTVLENVALPLAYRGLSRSDRQRTALEALEKVDMGHRSRHYPFQLSGGQQQRTAVARAIAGSPSIILADEPTGNLDSRNSEMVMGLLRDLHRQGTTLCVVTHDTRYSEHADRRVYLFDGRIVDQSSMLPTAATLPRAQHRAESV